MFNAFLTGCLLVLGIVSLSQQNWGTAAINLFLAAACGLAAYSKRR